MRGQKIMERSDSFRINFLNIICNEHLWDVIPVMTVVGKTSP